MPENEQLKTIENLLVLNLIDDKNDRDAIKMLHRADYTSSEIGEYLGISASTVRNKISDLREEGEIQDD